MIQQLVSQYTKPFQNEYFEISDEVLVGELAGMSGQFAKYLNWETWMEIEVLGLSFMQKGCFLVFATCFMTWKPPI